MLTFNTFNLTSEQIDLISTYRHKWQQVALNKERINRERAKLAINKAYDFLNIPVPNIVFLATPYDALEYLHGEITNSWGKLNNSALGSPVAGDLIAKLLDNIKSEIRKELLEKLQGNLDEGLADRIAAETANKLEANELFSIIWANARDMAIAQAKDSDTNDLSKTIFQLFFEAGFIFNHYISFPLWQMQGQITSLFSDKPQAEINNMNQTFSMLFSGSLDRNNSKKYQLPIIEVSSRVANVIVPSVMADFAYYIDYCHQVLNCDRDSLKWNIFNDLITNCGWIFPYKKTVLICDRKG